MTREKQVTRICQKCKLDKRTTVHLIEEAVYFCRKCKKEAGETALRAPKGIVLDKQPSLKKGAIWVAILMLISFLVGKFVF
ncbi:MAG: hypothetical protein IH948_06400 [Bacteroidetes bacterium]|nr:hypothetical protein [Bacteroidota bacterium]